VNIHTVLYVNKPTPKQCDVVETLFPRIYEEVLRVPSISKVAYLSAVDWASPRQGLALIHHDASQPEVPEGKSHIKDLA
jgi:hypothetical protein